MTDLISFPTSHKNIVCIFGLPLAGKTFVCNVIKSNYRCTHIVAGDIARSLIKTEEVRVQTANNDLYPNSDELQTIMLNEIHAAPNGLILLDGFPRTPSQVKFLYDNVNEMFPTLIECNVGDTVTLEKRAQERNRDAADSPNEFKARLAAAKSRLDAIYKEAGWRLMDQYTIMTSGDESSILTQFNNIAKEIL